MCLCTCAFVCVCVCVHVYVCMYACMHVCMYACMHVCMYACMHVCMYACMYVCVIPYICFCTLCGILWLLSTTWWTSPQFVSPWGPHRRRSCYKWSQFFKQLCSDRPHWRWACHWHTHPVSWLGIGHVDRKRSREKTRFHQKFQVYTYNGSTEPYKAILGLGFPLHKPYPSYCLYRFLSLPILGRNVWWTLVLVEKSCVSNGQFRIWSTKLLAVEPFKAIRDRVFS